MRIRGGGGDVRILVACALVLVLVVMMIERCSSKWSAMACSHWSIVYDGYGSVSCDGDRVVLEPRRALVPEATHAALATSRTTSTAPGAVTVVDARMRTLEQLRQGTDPNAWEVAWLLWNYQDSEHFYALVLKPNGWEVSKQDPAYPGKQRFLASGSTPTFIPNIVHDVSLSIDATSDSAMSVEIEVDGRRLTTVVDTEAPYTNGPVAAYTEDARVEISLEHSDSRPPESGARSQSDEGIR